MPELSQRWGYPAVLAFTGAACVLLYWRLRKADWI
jgi:Mg2+ and Co2+ transporter CorA